MVKAVAVACVAATALDAQPSPLPSSSLRVRDASGWVTWWASDSTPTRWTDHPLAARIAWSDERNGIAWSELLLAGVGEGWRTRLVVVRIDPRRVRLELDTGFVNERAAWRVDRMSRPGFSDVVFAVNAGQFVQTLPWGWVVMGGRQFLPALRGPLASSVIIDTGGAVRWQHGFATADSLKAPPAFAFQSYPSLIVRGEVPAALRNASLGIDVRHRDARLAIGSLDGGELLVAMTRFDGLGESLGALPFGITSPEMAAVMGALGVRDAVMLDGGISAQLMLRDERGDVRAWRGLRGVPLALIARRR